MKKGTAGLLLGIAAIMGHFDSMPDMREPKSKRGNNPIKPEDIKLNNKQILPKGCQMFNINGVDIVAINQKNAINKYNKKFGITK
jgi:hypothetical protein